VLQAGIVNSHDSFLEKTYGNQGSFLWERLDRLRESQGISKREMIAGLRLSRSFSKLPGDRFSKFPGTPE
jgi:hypothetical protein